MINRILFRCVFFLFLGTFGLFAQEIPTASGGEATGPGGTSSYSIGQVFYSTFSNSNGTISQGVEQPFEIYATLGKEENSIVLMSAHPNPTDGYLILTASVFDNLSYELYDLQGRLLYNKEVTSDKTTILFENLPRATYFLNVKKKSQTIKTFKIIKK